MVGKENGTMSRVNGSGANRPQERRNYAHENIFLLELRTRRLSPCVITWSPPVRTSEKTCRD